METITGLTGAGEAGRPEAGLTGTSLTGLGLSETSGLSGLTSGERFEADRQRVAAVVETLATLRGEGESLAEVAHDARNMVTALGLYCDLLEEPGVLNPAFTHYGGELRLVATASRRLVEKLVALDTQLTPESTGVREPGRQWGEGDRRVERGHHWELLPAVPIDNLASELLANRNLLSALAGPAVALTVNAEGGARPVRLTGEDLTRILVNLVKNAAEAMPAGGRINLSLRERPGAVKATPWLTLTIEDNGPGIPKKTLEKVFDSGFTTHAMGAESPSGWAAAHRGLGLSITRSIIEAAGGHIRAANRTPASGARFEIELPVRQR
jgi:signal transduction histidine kinase